MLLHVLDNVKKKTRHNMYVKAMIKLVINQHKKNTSSFECISG